MFTTCKTLDAWYEVVHSGFLCVHQKSNFGASLLCYSHPGEGARYCLAVCPSVGTLLAAAEACLQQCKNAALDGKLPAPHQRGPAKRGPTLSMYVAHDHHIGNVGSFLAGPRWRGAGRGVPSSAAFLHRCRHAAASAVSIPIVEFGVDTPLLQ